MLNGLLGKKIGMTQIFTSEGTVIPVTVLQLGPCVVVQKKTKEKDGYNALQLGFEKLVKIKKVNKPMLGHFKKHNVEPLKYLKEVKVDNPDEYSEGQEVTVEIFKEGDFVDVQGISKGKGFQGVIKRHGFAGGPASHGSKFHRAPGSIGMCEFPGETPKGRKMPGRMGGDKVTVMNLEVVKVIPDKNLVLVKGAVPGHNNSVVFVRKAIKARKRA
ncbi:50S ribosomal protein L3 [Deferribacter autotrophicus]|uniref:Large ribosomal subunit protein uL3 n=1 Tax=Deferribacter autotrophicus TaxID=500465 RepID=A0A5A8F8F9_9BACT|nr:50S ribosomal protein L3 [Deferribacter autotrophicus]